MSSTVGKKQRRRPVLVEQLEGRVLMTRLVGLDVSSYQGTINWTSVANTKDFAIIRASTGLGADSTFSTNMTNAIAAGMYAGSYHYAYYDRDNHTPSYEANLYWNQIKGKLANDGKHMIPMLDVEEGTGLGSGVGATSLSDWVNQWCAIISSDFAGAGYANVTPWVYTSGSHAGTYFDSTIPLNYPLVDAAWPGDGTGDSVNTQTGVPSTTGDWQTWQAWQYADKGTVSGISGNVDLDVFSGDDLTMKSFIIGSAGRWADNSWVTTTTSVTAWATGKANTSGTTVASGVTGKILQGPTYGNSYWRWQVLFNNGVTGWVAEPLMKTATPATPTAPTPANSTTTWLSSLPTNFAWTGANASSDKVYVDGVLKTTATTNAWAHTAIADGTHTWRVDPVNAELSGTGTTWNFKIDTTGPGAAYGNQSPGYGSATMQFTVTYTDASSGVDYTSLNTGDISVTGPGGYSQTATFVSVDTASNGATRVATYSVPAPGGTWDHDDDGLYTVALAANQVKDAAGNYKAATTLSSFAVGLGFAYLDGSVLKITFGSPGPITLSVSGTTMTATQSTSSYSFTTASFNQVLLGMTSGADALVIGGAVGAPLIFAGDTGGADTITFNSGSSALVASDPSGAAVTVNSGAVMALSTPATFSTVTVNSGKVVLAAGRTNTLRFSNLVFSGTGSLNPSDNDLIWDYSGATPINTLRGYLLSGRNGGTWNGPGIDSSSDVESVSNGMGYAEATDLGVTTYDGQTVDTTTLLVKYTPVGDANLDGYVDSDDYVLIDRGMNAGIPAGAAHWTDGDFNYNGSIDAGDYLLIDATNAREASGVAFDAESLAIREAQFGDVYVETLLSQGTTQADTSVVTADEGTQADIVVIEPAVMEETVVSTPAQETVAASPAVVVPLVTASHTTDESSKTHKPLKKTGNSIFEAMEKKHHGKTA